VKELIVDPKSENIAAITVKPNRAVVVFHPKSGIEAPLAQISTNPEDQIRCGLFVPQNLRRGHCSEVHWQSASSLLVMGKRDKLFHFVLKKHADGDEDEMSVDVTDATLNAASLVTPFGSHLISMAERRADRDQRPHRATIQDQSSRIIDQILQTPTHVMPSPSLLVEGLLTSFLNDQQQDGQSEKMEVNSKLKAVSDSEDGDEDSDTEKSVTKAKKSRVIDDSSAERELIDKLQNSVKLEKVKLPKFKDYDWIKL